MAKSNKNIFWIILIIVAIVIFMQPSEKTVLKGATADVTSATLSRDTSSDVVKIGTSWSVGYSTSTVGVGSYVAAITDNVVGGCNPIQANLVIISPDTQGIYTYTAPTTAGTCTFDGVYTYAGSTEKTIATKSVTICQDACAADGCESTTQKYTCALSGPCKVKSITTCPVNEKCGGAGVCAPDCSGELKPNLMNAALVWISSPTLANKQTLMQTAIIWITKC